MAKHEIILREMQAFNITKGGAAIAAAQNHSGYENEFCDIHF